MPSSTPDRITQWEFAGPGAATVPTRDLRFTEATLAWLRATGLVDMQRVYAYRLFQRWEFHLATRAVEPLGQLVPRLCPAVRGAQHMMLGLSDPAATADTQATCVRDGYRRLQLVEDSLGVQQPTPPDAVSAWITRNRPLDPTSRWCIPAGRGAGTVLEPRRSLRR